MKKNIHYILVVAVVCLSAFTLTGYAEKDKQKNKSPKNSAVSKKDKASKSEKEKDFWMQAKLKKSQRILAELTEGDFKSVEKNARALQGFGILESWLRDSPETSKSEYKAQLNKFEFANKELIRMAEDNNADGAANAFAALTITCVKCHNLIRDTEEK